MLRILLLSAVCFTLLFSENFQQDFKVNFQQAINLLKLAESTKSPNLLNKSKNAFDTSKQLYETKIKKSISDPKIIAAYEANIARYLGRYNTAASALAKKSEKKAKKPQNKYQGSNRAKYEKMVLEAWKEKYPNDEVLEVIFHMKKFRRKKEKEWHRATKSYRYSDMSLLAVKVVVKSSENRAKLYMAYININNMNEEMTIGVNTKGSEYVVQEIAID